MGPEMGKREDDPNGTGIHKANPVDEECNIFPVFIHGLLIPVIGDERAERPGPEIFPLEGKEGFIVEIIVKGPCLDQAPLEGAAPGPGSGEHPGTVVDIVGKVAEQYHVRMDAFHVVCQLDLIPCAGAPPAEIQHFHRWPEFFREPVGEAELAPVETLPPGERVAQGPHEEHSFFPACLIGRESVFPVSLAVTMHEAVVPVHMGDAGEAFGADGKTAAKDHEEIEQQDGHDPGPGGHQYAFAPVLPISPCQEGQEHEGEGKVDQDYVIQEILARRKYRFRAAPHGCRRVNPENYQGYRKSEHPKCTITEFCLGLSILALFHNGLL